MKPVQRLTVQQCLCWWSPSVLPRIIDWATTTFWALPLAVRQEIGGIQPDHIMSALGLLLILHDEYDVAPQYRLLPDCIATMLRSAAMGTLFCQNQEPDMHLPATVFLSVIDEARRGLIAYLPTDSDHDASDRLTHSLVSAL